MSDLHDDMILAHSLAFIHTPKQPMTEYQWWTSRVPHDMLKFALTEEEFQAFRERTGWRILPSYSTSITAGIRESINPFCRHVPDGVLDWNGKTVEHMAATIMTPCKVCYDMQEMMPAANCWRIHSPRPDCERCRGTGCCWDNNAAMITADAVEESGFENPRLATHLRSQEKCLVCDGKGKINNALCSQCIGSNTYGRIGLYPVRHTKDCWAIKLLTRRLHGITS